MRQFTTLLTASLILMGGCSSNFDPYVPSSAQEKAISSYQNVRLLRDGKSEAVLSTIYLNEVYPIYADGSAHFLVAFYSSEHNSTLRFSRESLSSTDDYLLTLNGESALEAEELEEEDCLRELMPIHTRWSRYYHVRYTLPSGNPVLTLESDHTVQARVTYQKDEQ